ncbi:Diguanylate cyclase/phosphodiesterase (GGDEF & EAL domains) with PAS/PAC sensor(S) (plasmid) [Rhizobium leguminosarum]|uniref:Diguanylate cyclase/phosphodiesterase (GGDEF & EAL domains) with PAS/PAC sensor(S) n=2 Tax=Rhizobium leguminosarum TaxID=384 RepID=A0A2K9ZGD8_RHILE|nr:Diguanylate cyclase/phosphodiesterase (GGDEF & EAL domains) with PAS/PAC sensor(S) [Rhizobium leguminosarum]
MIKPASPIRSSQPLIILAGNFEDAAPVAARLRELGWSCVCSPDYPTFEQQARLLKPDLLLLDSGVSDAFVGDGKRRKGIEYIPAIHLVSAAADRAPAFAAGAVDCVVKPILLEELVARIQVRIELLRTQKQLDQCNMQFTTILESIGQGACLFDADQRLVLSNRRYAKVYGLAPEMIQPGMTLSDITELRYSVGACPAVASDEYLAWCDSINSSPSSQDWSMELKSGKVIRVHHERTSDGGWVSTHEDITEHRTAERQIAHLALHDPLTDLPNRAALKQKLDAMLEQHRTQGSPFAVLCLDLDRFKEVNDVFGHNVGDLVLCLAAKRLNAVAQGAFVARLGGDEFMVLVEADANSIAQLADLIISALSEDADIEGTRIRMGTSLGVAVYPADGDSAADLMGNADAALYRAKADGPGVARFFEPQMDKWLRERRALQRDLQAAISQQQLSVFYQPQANIGGDVTGFEALLRWNHPSQGNIPPSVFIPIAEESSLMIEIGAWVLREACREAASWPRKLSVAVNLSPVQFKHGDLTGLVKSVLIETGLEPERLELEITEGVLINDHERAISTLGHLKALGVRIAMDDFGTGYSSLSYLQSFPFDKIKIDQSFVRNIGLSQSSAIIRAVIGLGRGLDLPIIAEGVETTDQLAFLTRELCDQVQGYLVGRPRPISDYAKHVGRADEQPVSIPPDMLGLPVASGTYSPSGSTSFG